MNCILYIKRAESQLIPQSGFLHIIPDEVNFLGRDSRVRGQDMLHDLNVNTSSLTFRRRPGRIGLIVMYLLVTLPHDGLRDRGIFKTTSLHSEK